MKVLFQGDRERYYPGAIYDTQTTNRTFVEYVGLLAAMGVQNRYWCLTLLNPLLQGVDPFDEANLTPELKTIIRTECELNPWYFIREILRFPPPSGPNPIRLRANRANMSLWWCFLNHIDYFLIQPRQTGKSVNSDGITTWYMLFGAQSTNSNLFTKDAGLIQANILRLKRIRALLPTYLVVMTKEDSDNQKDLTYVHRNNYLKAVQAQANPDAAANVGRGLTAAYNHIDEICYLKYNHISVGIMLAGAGAAREEARRQGMPYCNIFTSTAGKLDSSAGRYAHELLNAATKWSEHYYDSTDPKHLVERLRVNSANQKSPTVLINGTFSHRQLGYDDEWLRVKIAESRQEPDDARRDFLNEWTLGNTTKHPLGKKIMRQIDKGRMAPVWEQHDPKYSFIMRWYIPKEEVLSGIKSRTLIMGMDMSEGVNRDACTGVILDISTLEVVGTYGVSETNLSILAMWFCKLLETFTTLTMVPEAKSTWRAVQDQMIITCADRGIDYGRRVYSTIVDDSGETRTAKKLYDDFKAWRSGYNHYTTFKREFGFGTNRDKRNLIYEVVLKEAAKTAGWLMRDETLIGELKGIQQVGNRLDHGEGGHDDYLISWLLGHWFIAFGKNLSHYGIDPMVVRSRVYNQQRKMSNEEKADEVMIRYKRTELQELVAEYEAIGRHGGSSTVMLKRIAKLQDDLGEDMVGDMASTIDALKEQSNTIRKMERQSRANDMDYIRISQPGTTSNRWANFSTGYGRTR